MSIISSFHYLIQFLSFIYIIPVCFTFNDKIQFIFRNGLNIIRCSDNQVQVYKLNSGSQLVLSQILQCTNKNELYFKGYAGFEWSKLKTICTSQSVHEEQYIERTIDSEGGIDRLSYLVGQLGYSGESYELQIVDTGDEEIKIIKSEDQPINDQYYNKNTKQRRIYIKFKDHPIICRILFTGNNPCSTGNDEEIENVEHVCYYNPCVQEHPTIHEMEAELEQVEAIRAPNYGEYYVLDLEKPDASSFIPSNTNSGGSSNSKPNNPSNNNQNPSASINNSPKTKRKLSPLKIIGIIFIVLLILGLIGGVGFYMIRKYRLNQSSSNIENGNNQSSLSITQSNQSIPNTIEKEKPNIELQKSNTNKRQRAATNMDFNEDM